MKVRKTYAYAYGGVCMRMACAYGGIFFVWVTEKTQKQARSNKSDKEQTQIALKLQKRSQSHKLLERIQYRKRPQR